MTGSTTVTLRGKLLHVTFTVRQDDHSNDTEWEFEDPPSWDLTRDEEMEVLTTIFETVWTREK